MAPAAEQARLPWEGPTLGSQHSQFSEHRDPADCRSCRFTQFLAETAPGLKPFPSCSVGFFLSP